MCYFPPLHSEMHAGFTHLSATPHTHKKCVPPYYYSKCSVLALISSHSSVMASECGRSLRDLCPHQQPLWRDAEHEGKELYPQMNWYWKAGMYWNTAHPLTGHLFFFFTDPSLTSPVATAPPLRLPLPALPIKPPILSVPLSITLSLSSAKIVASTAILTYF